jgi:lipopolysaccharide transport system ATP-binding protein
MSIAIRAEHLGKRYRIGERRHTSSVREAFGRTLSRAARRLRGPTPSATATANELWAIDDLSFEIAAGETVGIIGRNGAGKSTLLKVLSQITEPTTGWAEVTGRVGSLLEVGTGFHADLSGRDNTYLNGAILGMTKAEIDRKFDEIVAFADVERFIDTPVKHYSSGMYMRLAFAVAAHLETEILVVDEVLAVGDAQFQKKCLGKMDDIARHGRTVLFISHNMEAVQRLCTRGMLMDRGRLVASGTMDDVVSEYRSLERLAIDVGHFNARGRRGEGWAHITDIRLVDESGARVDSRPSDADLLLEFEVAVEGHGGNLGALLLHIVLCAADGRPLISLTNVDDGGAQLPPAKRCVMTMRLPGPTVVAGRYRLNAFLGIPHVEHVDEIPDAFEFDITPPEHPWRPFEMSPASGPVCRLAAWECRVGDESLVGGALGVTS